MILCQIRYHCSLDYDIYLVKVLRKRLYNLIYQFHLLLKIRKKAPTIGLISRMLKLSGRALEFQV